MGMRRCGVDDRPGEGPGGMWSMEDGTTSAGSMRFRQSHLLTPTARLGQEFPEVRGGHHAVWQLAQRGALRKTRHDTLFLKGVRWNCGFHDFGRYVRPRNRFPRGDWISEH